LPPGGADPNLSAFSSQEPPVLSQDTDCVFEERAVHAVSEEFAEGIPLASARPTEPGKKLVSGEIENRFGSFAVEGVVVMGQAHGRAVELR
jgi:hypothetical protein